MAFCLKKGLYRGIRLQHDRTGPKIHNKYSLKYIASKMIRGKSNGEKSIRNSYKKEDSIIGFHRKLMEPIVDLIEPISIITPNRVTWFGCLLALLSSVALGLGTFDYAFMLIASFLYWFSALLDCVDGQLARKRKTSSLKGEWLDVVLEFGKGIFFWIAVGFNITSYKSEIWGFNVWFVIAIALSFLGFLTFMSIYTSWLFRESQPVSHGHVYIVLFIIIANILELALIIFTFLVILSVIYTLFEKTFLFQPEENNM